MGILDGNVSRDLRLDNLVIDIKNSSINIYNKIETELLNSFRLVWENPDFTPQEIFDQFGSDSYELFVFSRMMQDCMIQINPNYIYLVPPYEYVMNPDGTVTVGERIVPDVQDGGEVSGGE